MDFVDSTTFHKALTSSIFVMHFIVFLCDVFSRHSSHTYFNSFPVFFYFATTQFNLKTNQTSNRSDNGQSNENSAEESGLAIQHLYDIFFVILKRVSLVQACDCEQAANYKTTPIKQQLPNSSVDFSRYILLCPGLLLAPD